MQTTDFPIPADLSAWIERLSRFELAAGETLPLFAGARGYIGFVLSGSVYFGASNLAWHRDQAACLGAITRAGEQAVAGDEGASCLLVKLAGGVAPGVIGRSAELCTDRIVPLQTLWPDVAAINLVDPLMSQRERRDEVCCALRRATDR